MKPTRTGFLTLLALLALLALPQPAKASAASDLTCLVLNEASKYSSNLPSCGDVQGAVGVIDCMSSGEALPNCLAQHSGEFNNDTIETVIDLMIAVNNKDLWGVLGIVGDDALCAIAGILVPGAGSLCQLVTEILNALGSVLGEIGAFFADLAEAFWNALEDLYCATIGALFGGCDDDDATTVTPPPIVIWDRYFATLAQPGNSMVPNLIAQDGDDRRYVKGGYLHKEAISWAVSQGYTAADVNQAFTPPFTDVVAAKWQARVLVDLPRAADARRVRLHDGEIKAAGGAVWDEILTRSKQYQSFNLDPLAFVLDKCKLGLRQFQHVETWMGRNPDKATTLAPQGWKTNSAWCVQDFRDPNKPKIAVGIVDAMKASQSCTASAGNRLACDGAKMQNLCKMALGPFGQADRCRLAVAEELDRRCPPTSNPRRLCPTRPDFSYCTQHIAEVDGPGQKCSFTPAVANGEADGVRAALAAAGSVIPCAQRNSNAINQASGLVCSRPRQNEYCRLHSDARLLSCELVEDPAYTALKLKVQQTVATLNAELARPPGDADNKGKNAPGIKDKNAGLGGAKSGGAKKDGHAGGVGALRPATGVGAASDARLAINPGDPLYVSTRSIPRCQGLKGTNANYGFAAPSTKPGFDYLCESPMGDHLAVLPGNVDGLSTPMLGLPVQMPDMSIDTGNVVGKNLVTDIRAGRRTVGPHPEDRFAVARDSVTNSMANRVDRVGNIANVGANVAPQQAAGGAHVAQGGFATGLAGNLPAQGAAAPGAAPTVVMQQSGGTGDIVPAGALNVGGVAAAWNGSVAVGAAGVRARRNGECEVNVDYGVRNAGTGFIGAFRATWTNGAVSGSRSQNIAPLPAAATRTQSIALPLRNGTNALTLMLDDMQQQAESSETNNVGRVTVTLTDTCGAASSAPAVSAPGLPGGGFKPAPRGH